MDAADIELRNATYPRFVELGRAPTAGEIAEQPRTREQNQAILTRLGLTDPFWSLG